MSYCSTFLFPLSFMVAESLVGEPCLEKQALREAMMRESVPRRGAVTAQIYKSLMQKENWDIVVEGLSSDNENMREFAEIAVANLVFIDPDCALPYCVDALQKANERSPECLVEVFQWVKSQAAIPALRDKLSVRPISAALALAWNDDRASTERIKTVRQEYVDHLAQWNTVWQARLAQCLKVFGAESARYLEAKEQLESRARGEKYGTVGELDMAIARLERDPKPLADARSKLASDLPWEVFHAVSLIGFCGTREDVRFLVPLLDSSDYQEGSAKALRRLTALAFYDRSRHETVTKDEIHKWKQWWAQQKGAVAPEK